MSPRISVLCPTRGRPGSVFRLADSMAQTAAGETELVLYADDDAPDSVSPAVASRPWVTVVTGSRIVMSDMWNRCLDKASADIVMQCADDIVFRTPGWDDQVCAAFAGYPDRIALVYGNDLIHGKALATHSFAHHRVDRRDRLLHPAVVLLRLQRRLAVRRRESHRPAALPAGRDHRASSPGRREERVGSEP